ncbi:hypothetical protein BC830DRAFT_1112838 [Chytriomyces sp. MP71]|nr:hypothetical protein BC830DRAFT_1112838 [Chytriomyces sp. MP71]
MRLECRGSSHLSLVFILLDIVKVQIIRCCNFGLTVKMVRAAVRKAKLTDRTAKRNVRKRVFGSVAKVRKVLYMTWVSLPGSVLSRRRRAPSSEGPALP